MENTLLLNVFIFLMAACLVVPIAGRLKLGSVLGYLAAGIAIGPFGLALIANTASIMHFAEFGVVMMLFIIGLELDPPTLWRLRKSILGLGGLQVTLTSLVFTAAGVMLGYDWRTSLACALALSLSSTALVLQILQEKGLLQTQAGEASFSVLLFQDIAVIPILVILPLLAVGDMQTIMHNASLLGHLPGWQRTLITGIVVAAIVICGKYFMHHVFRFIAKTNLRDVFTAVSLALVIGIALVMQAVGLSPALGAFIAGVVLANSEYSRTLEANIEPFKGLLLGLFFISIGMGMDFALLEDAPIKVVGTVAALITAKMLILCLLGRAFGLAGAQICLLGLALAQGGEFAFVLFQYASGLGVVGSSDAAYLTLVVALSMAATPFLMMFNDRVIVPRFMSRLQERQADTITTNDNLVILAGYGRFGQIVGRFLKAQGIAATILEKDPDQIEMIRKFGTRGYFGDAGRLDLLQSAGADKAKLLVVAIDDADRAIEIVKMARLHFPDLRVFARARNRRHAYELDKAGAHLIRRETFDSSLWMAQEAMKFLGHPAAEMRRKAKLFMKHDIDSLRKSFAFFEREPEMISFSRQASEELARILQSDTVDVASKKAD